MVGVTMLTQSNVEIADVLRKFSGAGVDATFLVPTKTGLEKSILDATEPVRSYLKVHKIHDYGSQQQGPEHKVLIATSFFLGDEIIETKASLYRPETKNGDPRIWFSMLSSYADPSDLIAVIACDDRLIAINCSRINLSLLIGNTNSRFWKIYKRSNEGMPKEASELLGLLRSIGRRGFIKTMREGDTGIGFTLESLLGIKANSGKTPDFKGIELKSSRLTQGRSGMTATNKSRTTIFSQVPDWSISRLKSTGDILFGRGKFNEENNRFQLRHSLYANKLNSYLLGLEVDEAKALVHQIHVVNQVKTVDVSWKVGKLVERLLEKHKQTCWVNAATKSTGKDEAFHYQTVRYTSGVNTPKLTLLIDAGIISVDYVMKEIENKKAKDQGYLFKMKHDDIPLLFNAAQEFDLTQV